MGFFIFILTKVLGKPSCEQNFNHYYGKYIIIICAHVSIFAVYMQICSVSVGILRHIKCQRNQRLESSISQKEKLGCADGDMD